jgi:hypothetical protein
MCLPHPRIQRGGGTFEIGEHKKYIYIYIKLCKILGFHGGDYEDCRLLAYKNSVRTSQETHYVSTTESSQF